MTEPSTPSTGAPRVRIRWGWILGCLALGLVAITAGLLLVAPADRAGYVASVLGGVGTTLLLVGIVVLLERKIVDTAAKAVRRAVAADRAATDERIDALTTELQKRVAEEWAASDGQDVDALKRRTSELTDEMVERVVDEANEYVEERERDAGAEGDAETERR